jgi:putative transposase
LRGVFRETRRSHPFTIDAVAVLPDRLHTVWTLPAADAYFAARWGLIKSAIRAACRTANAFRTAAPPKANAASGSGAWEHTIRDENDFARHVHDVHVNSVKHGLVARVRVVRRSTVW